MLSLIDACSVALQNYPGLWEETQKQVEGKGPKKIAGPESDEDLYEPGIYYQLLTSKPGEIAAA